MAVGATATKLSRITGSFCRSCIEFSTYRAKIQLPLLSPQALSSAELSHCQISWFRSSRSIGPNFVWGTLLRTKTDNIIHFCSCSCAKTAGACTIHAIKYVRWGCARAGTNGGSSSKFLREQRAFFLDNYEGILLF